MTTTAPQTGAASTGNQASLRQRSVSTAKASTTSKQHGTTSSSSSSSSSSQRGKDASTLKEREPSTRLAYLLLWVFLIHCGAIYLFTRGFLLTRSVLDDKSECSNNNIVGDDKDGSSLLMSNDECWYPQQYKKAVIIVIDALRFDFVVPHDNLPEDTQEPYYINKLPVVHNLLKKQPDNTLVYQFVADPPTTTLQRLKGLTTGTLPTIIDAGSNFASSTLKEDNWLSQFENSRGKDRILFLGDDTWVGLFPTILTANNSHPFPSLDTHDLHTLDNGVIKELGPALKDPSRWDLLIAHFLGVDHCGHTFGPSDPQMADKLEQMNQQLEQVIESVSDDTLVIIMGDHGMNQQGDHGGDSDDEIQAGLVMYSKRKLNNAQALAKDVLGETLHYTEPVGGHIYRKVSQIDLVPTLSLLLGLPIPFNNLGSIIPELFLTAHKRTDAVRHLLRATHLNAAQVATYFRSYKEHHPTSDIAQAVQTEFGHLYEQAKDFMYSAGGLDSDTESMVQAQQLYSVYLRAALSSCKRIWASFDVPLMVAGGSILLASCICLVLHITIFRSVGSSPSLGRYLLGGQLLGIALARHLRPLLFRMEAMQESSMGLLDVTILSMATFSILGFLLSMIVQGRNVFTKSESWNAVKGLFRLPPLSGFLACLFIVVNCLIFGSNSYIIHESTFVIGFLQTFGVIGLLFSFRVPEKAQRHKAVVLTLSFMAMTRLLSLSTVCREEQGDLCTPTFYASAQQTVPSQWSLVTLVGSGAITPYLIRRLLSVTKSMNGIALIWIDYGLRLGIVLGAIYSVLDAEGSKPSNERFKATVATTGTTDDIKVDPLAMGMALAGGSYVWIKTTLVRFAFGLALIVGPAAWWTNPLCLDIKTVDVPVEAGTGAGARGKTGGAAQTERKIYILGYANAFGASYFVALTMLFLFVSLTQKPLGAIVLSVGLAQIAFLVELVDIWRDAEVAVWQQGVIARVQAESALMTEEAGVAMAGTEEEDVEGVARAAAMKALKAQPSHPRLNLMLPTVVLSLMANLLFFATGHQATLSSIQWASAFVGIQKLNFVFSPVLVVVNTLGAYLMCAAALPLVVLWKLPPRGDKTGKISLFPELTRLCLMMMMHQSVVLVVNMFFTGAMFRRHLMVWKIFAPRYMLQATALLAMDWMLVVVVVLLVLAKVMREVSRVLSVKIV
ncbi:mannose-ethanolamine phosphotransferase gpi13 [Podila epigama]|nr:mannose-ethanolamine phosphotransferase gpi13 [Podila epigama]